MVSAIRSQKGILVDRVVGAKDYLQPAEAFCDPVLPSEVARRAQHQGLREASAIRRFHQWHASERFEHRKRRTLVQTLTTPTDYLQALSDENMINVEKIGSGNWYWSFASENKKIRQKALENAKSTHDKAAAVADDLKQKLAEAQAQREEEEDMLDSGAETREELVASKAVLESEVKDLQKQLAAYTDTDPTEVERKVKEVQRFKAEAEQYTDDIYSIEGWLKQQPVDEEALKQMRMNTYGDQLDEEEGVLKELV